MGVVDATCNECRRSFRWLAGTPMVCNECQCRGKVGDILDRLEASAGADRLVVREVSPEIANRGQIVHITSDGLVFITSDEFDAIYDRVTEVAMIAFK